MKKLVLILLFLLSSFNAQLFAQLTNPGRGMYVDKFLKYSSGTTVDYNNTILGIPNKENELLKYAKDNHIKF